MIAPAQLEVFRDLLDRDHERLLLLLEDVAQLSRAGSHRTAAKVFGQFRLLQEQHLVRTSVIVDRLATSGRCPASVQAHLTREQRRLRDAINTAWDHLASSDHAHIDQAIAGLTTAVGALVRVQKEELLPELCACFGDEAELEEVVHQMVDL